MTEKTADNYAPPLGEEWSFNAEVTNTFDSMLLNSIPSYAEMRKFTDMFIRRHLNHLGAPRIIDLGASRGEVLHRFIKPSVPQDLHQNAEFTLVEISEPMLAILRERYGSMGNVTIAQQDLRYNRDFLLAAQPTLVTCILTTIFTPLSYRQAILKSVFESLRPHGGTFIWVEKILGDGADEDELLTKEYYQFKADNGYTQEAILRKKLSLEFAQVPVTSEWNEQMLRKAGFSTIQKYWQSLNFAGWICKC